MCSPRRERQRPGPLIFLSVSGPSLLAGAIDLCSNHWRTGLSLEELRDLAQASNRDTEPSVRTIYRPHPLPERLGPRKIADIVRRYQEGESARSLAEKYKVAPSAVTRLLRENTSWLRSAPSPTRRLSASRRSMKPVPRCATLRRITVCLTVRYPARFTGSARRCGRVRRDGRPSHDVEHASRSLRDPVVSAAPPHSGGRRIGLVSVEPVPPRIQRNLEVALRCINRGRGRRWVEDTKQ